MKTLKDIVVERLILSKNTKQYTIDDITAKELCELVEKYKEYHGVLPRSTNSTKMDLHDIYGKNDIDLPYCKEPGTLDIQLVYISGINKHPISRDDDYGLSLMGTRNQMLFRFGMTDLIDTLGKNCLIEIYSFLKRKVEELEK